MEKLMLKQTKPLNGHWHKKRIFGIMKVSQIWKQKPNK